MNQTERRKFLLAASALLVAPLAEAQKEEKIVRIGFLSAQTRAVDSGRIAVGCYGGCWAIFEADT